MRAEERLLLAFQVGLIQPQAPRARQVLREVVRREVRQMGQRLAVRPLEDQRLVGQVVVLPEQRLADLAALQEQPLLVKRPQVLVLERVIRTLLTP